MRRVPALLAPVAACTAAEARNRSALRIDRQEWGVALRGTRCANDPTDDVMELVTALR